MTSELPSAVVLLDAENIFHPYGRSAGTLQVHKRQAIEAAHPHISIASALRLGAAVAVDIVDWIDQRHARSVSRSIAKNRDPSTPITQHVLRERGFTLEPVPNGKNRADYAVVGRLFLRLSSTQEDATYIIGSGDGGVLKAVAHAEREVKDAREDDELPAATFVALTPRLGESVRAGFEPNHQYGKLHLVELPTVIAEARGARAGDVARVRARRALVERALEEPLRDLADAESLQRAFAEAAIGVAVREAGQPVLDDPALWRDRVRRAFGAAGAPDEFATAAVDAMMATDRRDAAADDDADFDSATFVLDVSFGILGTAAADLLRDSALHELVASTKSPAVWGAFLRLLHAPHQTP